jgi:hypothetical protein
LGFGKELGYLEDNADQYEYIEAVQKMLPLISIVSAIPLAVTILSIPFVKAIVAPNGKDKKGIGKLLTQVYPTFFFRFNTQSKLIGSQINQPTEHLIVTLEKGRT